MRITESGKDGGTGGLGVHCSPQTYQEYMYRWRNSHRAPAKCQQRALDTSKYKKVFPCNQVGQMRAREGKEKRKGGGILTT